MAAHATYCGSCGACKSSEATAALAAPATPGGISARFAVGGVAVVAIIIAVISWAMTPRELTPDYALEIIAAQTRESITAPLQSEEWVFPVNVVVDPATGAFMPYQQQQIDQARARLAPLKNAGYIDVVEEPMATQMFSQRLGNVKFVIRTTAKMAPFIINSAPNGGTIEVKVGEIVPGTVTSLTTTPTLMKTARYTRMPEMNELAGLLKFENAPNGYADTEVMFALVDGDWIIQGEYGH